MSLMRLDQLFEVHNGLASSEVLRSSYSKNENWIPYVRPSYRQDSSIDAFVNKQLVPQEKIFPKGTLYVSTDGQGSHSYAYVSASEFVPNSNVSVLIPRLNMSLGTKFFYALCISRNRPKFSYGRKPKGERLKSILLPSIDSVPDNAQHLELWKIHQSLENSVHFEDLEEGIHHFSDETVLLDDLFFVENGLSSSEVIRSLRKKNDNWIPYLRPSHKQSSSIDAYVNKFLVPQEKVFPKGTLYVSTDGQGSHTYAYVSVSEFVPNSNVCVLIPKREMNLREKLAYALFISRNRYKFSYGRKPKGERLKTILLPASIPKEWNEMPLTIFRSN